jgi:predicted deacylase
MITLLSGSVTFIPVCNPLAKEKNVRYIEENLARVFDEHKNPVSYEQKLATQLSDYVKNADAILDIHS